MKSISMKNSFSLERVIQLCKRYVAIKKNMILIGASAIIGLLLIVYALILSFAPSDFTLSNSLVVMTFAFMIFKYTGYAFTSTMFNELNNSGSAPQFYNLPANTSEKLFSAWLLSYVCYTLIGLVALYIFTLISGMSADWFFSKQTMGEIVLYTIVQSIYFFGAVYFKANNFISTLVALLAFNLSLVLIYLALKTYIPGFEEWLSSVAVNFIKSVFSNNFTNVLFTIVISAMIMWFAYRKLKNRQIA